LRLTIYGRDVVLKVFILTVLLDFAAILIEILWLKALLIALSLILISFTLYFFRDPVRNIPQLKDNEILSPGDGKVMCIEEVDGNDFMNSRSKLIGIFLSPLNVHVNRIPLSGEVAFFRYVKGDYIVAFDHKSSERNERTEIGIDNGEFKILFKQIAGFVARRIVCQLRKGSRVNAGEKFGMIKFGSRVDVILPMNSTIKVKLKEKVVGGETILACLHSGTAEVNL